MNRFAVGFVCLPFLLAACGGSGGVKEKAESKPQVHLVSLKDSCPKIEETTQNDPLASTQEWTKTAKSLAKIAEEGDLETKNALKSMQEAVKTYEADPAQGQASVDAMGAYIDSIQLVADRCKLVGSSALQ